VTAEDTPDARPVRRARPAAHDDATRCTGSPRGRRPARRGARRQPAPRVLAGEPLRAVPRGGRLGHDLVGTADAGLPAEERLAPADWPIGGDDATAPTVAAPGQVRDVRLLRLPASGTLAGFLHGAKRRGLIHRVPVVGGLARALGWPLAARAWGRTLRDLPPADLYHACGIGAGVVARDLAVRAKRRGRHGTRRLRLHRCRPGNPSCRCGTRAGAARCSHAWNGVSSRRPTR
jgi:hypothetical protein